MHGSSFAYVCMFISFHRKSFSWLNKTNLMPEFRLAMVCCRNISVSSTFGSASKTIIERIFKLWKRVPIKPRIATRINRQLLQIFLKNQRSTIAASSLTSVIVLINTKVFRIFPNQHWLRYWNSKEDLFNMTAVTTTLNWTLLVGALYWNLLVLKSPHHVKMGFIHISFQNL